MERRRGTEERYQGHWGEALRTLPGGRTDDTEGRRGIGDIQERHWGHSGEALRTLTEDIEESTGTEDAREGHCAEALLTLRWARGGHGRDTEEKH